MPNPFLPRSPGGGTSTDRSASNPLNLIKPPFFAKNSAIVFEPLFSSQHQISITFVASSISSSYSFLEFHLCTCLKTTPWLVMGPYCKLLPLFGVFFSQTPIILFSQKLTNFGLSDFRSFEKKYPFLWDVTAVWWLFCSTQIIFCSRFVRDTNH